MSTLQTQTSLNYFRIAWQSALAAALGLGLPAGLLLWLILLQQVSHSAAIDQSIVFLQSDGLYKIWILALCSLLWSFLLGKISGYRPWLKIGVATVLGILAAWFSPLSNLDAWFGDGAPVHLIYAVAMGGIVGSVTFCVGLLYGWILRSGKAGLTLAFSTSLVAVLTLFLTILIFDWMGIRVGGSIPLAMSKVTVSSLLTSAILSGMVLGIGFTRFLREKEGYGAFL